MIEQDQRTLGIASDSSDPTAVIVSFLQEHMREGSRWNPVEKDRRSRDTFPLPYVPTQSVDRGAAAVQSGAAQPSGLGVLRLCSDQTF